MSIRTPSITLLPISTMVTTLAIMMSVGSLAHSIPVTKYCIINNEQIISADQTDKMILKGFNYLHSPIKNRKSNKIKNNKEISIVVNCYLKLDNQSEEKNYLEKMHTEIINMPVKESIKSLHKFGYLGYLREKVYDGACETSAIKHLFSEAWLEEEKENNNDRYCKISSDILKARLPKAIEIIMQQDEFENNNKNKTTRIKRQRQQQQQKQKEEHYSPRVKSLKDFVQLFEQKEKEGKNPRVYVPYW
jgi:hypothetical protein